MIGDASFIGLDCESGIIDDCNDGTEESVPPECSGIFMAPEKTTQCGSQCQLEIERSTTYAVDPSKNKTIPAQVLSTHRYWLKWKSLAENTFYIILNRLTQFMSHSKLGFLVKWD